MAELLPLRRYIRMAAVLPPIVMILIVGLIFYFAKRAADKEK